MRWAFLVLCCGLFSALLTACNECKNAGETFCKGNVRMRCSEGGGAERSGKNLSVLLEDCASDGMICVEQGGDSSCVFSQLRCAEQPRVELCYQTFRVHCAQGAVHPVRIQNCRSDRPDGRFCVERDTDTVCSAFEESCSEQEPHRCLGDAQFECRRGAWLLVSSTRCPSP